MAVYELAKLRIRGFANGTLLGTLLVGCVIPFLLPLLLPPLAIALFYNQSQII
ncbi:MAG: hypothetical protein ACFE0I_02110 [Elainellaceae cyanobacterium]